MKVTPPPQPGPTGGNSPPSDVAQLLDKMNLSPGSTTMAQVVTKLQSSAGDQPNLWQLVFNGQKLSVSSDAPLKPGQIIQVLRAGNQLQLMQILNAQPPSANPVSQLAQALAERLPFQHRLDQGIQQLLRLLATLEQPTQPTPLSQTATQSTEQPARQGQIPAENAALKEAIIKLAKLLPSASQLARLADQPEPAAAVKQMLAQSGHFTEPRLVAKLLQSIPERPILADLKVALFELVSAASGETHPDRLTTLLKNLKPSVSQELVQAPLQFPSLMPTHTAPTAQKQDTLDTGQLLKLLAGMLNRINVNQLHAQMINQQASQDGPPPHTLLVEIPWLNPQSEPRSLQLRLERREEGRQGDEHKRRKRVMQWRLNLSLDLDGLGPVHFELALQDRKLDTRVWAEQSNTVRLLERETPRLQERLDKLHLASVKIECRRGQPSTPRTQLEQRLVDIKA